MQKKSDSDVDNFAENFSENQANVDNSSTADNNRNSQAIGISRGGRTTKIHALVGDDVKPICLMLSEGNVNDCSVAVELLSLTTIEGKAILGDKAYGTREIMDYIRENGGTFCIPPKSNTKEPWEFDEELYKGRNVVERFFNQIRQYRAVAMRYDKLAKRFFSVVLLASIMVLLK